MPRWEDPVPGIQANEILDPLREAYKIVRANRPRGMLLGIILHRKKDLTARATWNDVWAEFTSRRARAGAMLSA